MVDEVFPTVLYMFNEVVILFEDVFTKLGGWGFFLGGFTIFLSYRFLLVPLFGNAGSSDKVRKKDTSSNMDK